MGTAWALLEKSVEEEPGTKTRGWGMGDGEASRAKGQSWWEGRKEDYPVLASVTRSLGRGREGCGVCVGG